MPHWSALLAIVLAGWMVLAVLGGWLIGRGIGVIERRADARGGDEERLEEAPDLPGAA